MAKPKKTYTLRRVNNLLAVIVLVLALYIIFLPFLPNLNFWWKSLSRNQPALVVANQSDAQTDKKDEQLPDQNTLVIPKLYMQEIINEGSSAAVLSKGVWRRPHTSNPDQGGNTVLVGHRFTYSDPAVFYHLNKVSVGDEIVLYWKKAKYTYTVSRVLVVPASAVEIEAPTDTPLLTIYTCTPIWTARDRLVIQATLKEEL